MREAEARAVLTNGYTARMEQPTGSAAPTARARARAELTEEIKACASRHLAEQGAAGLSLRAVARELGMASSAVYRYFPSRDELLTALIIDAYDAVGEVAEAAATGKGTMVKRFTAVAMAIRAWAVAHPHDYALVYGTPVPGYAAPRDTASPAARVSLAALQVVADGAAAGEVDVSVRRPMPIPKATRSDMARLRVAASIDLPDEVLLRVLLAWTTVFGTISFELFGHLHTVVEDYEAFFRHQVGRAALHVAGG